MNTGCVWMLALNAVSITFGRELARRTQPDGDAVRRLMVTILGKLSIEYGAVLFCGIIGRLDRVFIAGLTAVATALLVLTGRSGRRQASTAMLSAPNPHCSFHNPPTCDRDPIVIASTSVAFILTGVAWLWWFGVGTTRLGWDDYAYHLTQPCLWLQTGRIEPSPLSFQSAFPHGAEVLALWWMIPFGRQSQPDAMAWVGLTALPYAALACLSALLLTRPEAPRSSGGFIASILILTSHPVIETATSFCDVDLALPAFVLAGLALATTPGPRLGNVIGVSLASGLALATKYVALVPVGLIILSISWIDRPASGRRPWATAALVLVAAIAVSGHWFLRNVETYGNPLFPAPVLGLPGVEAISHRTTIAEYVRTFGWWKGMRDVLGVYLDWPASHAALALVGLVAAAGIAVLGRDRFDGTCRRRMFAVTVIAGAVLAVLPWQPMSAGHSATFAASEVHFQSMRFIVVVPMLGWIGLGTAIDSLRRWKWVHRVAAGVALLGAIIGLARTDWTIAAGLATGIVAAACVGGSRIFERVAPVVRSLLERRVRNARAASVVGLLAASVIVATAHSDKRAGAREALLVPFGVDIREGWERLNRMEPARTAGHCPVYVLFGENLQHSPVLIGGPEVDVDATFFASSVPAIDRLPDAEFNARLIQEGVEVFATLRYSFHGKSVSSPREAGWLDASVPFLRLGGDEHMTLWRRSDSTRPAENR
ncbi:MAG: hypothetical protein IT428_29795 [Planctomycetaceae bacterium]|nr:hypothetical protein [Planctomycetaceae bacterium]